MQEYPLNGFDTEARKFVLDQYKLRGINYHGLSSPTKITKGPNGKLTVAVEPYKREGDTFDIEEVDEVGGSGRKLACLKLIAARVIPLWQETAEALDHHDDECGGAVSTGDVSSAVRGLGACAGALCYRQETQDERHWPGRDWSEAQ